MRPRREHNTSALESLFRHAAPLVPLVLLQPVFTRIAQHVAHSRPELFRRLGPHAGKRFLIEPTDLPFLLVLTPKRDVPRLTVHRRDEHPSHEAAITGRFFDLLDMMDGSLDGDALFFSRALRISGDTEAVVALRNALDDFDGTALDTALRSFGPLSGVAALALSAIRPTRSAGA